MTPIWVELEIRFTWYNGKCQICGETWPKSDRNPYFAAAYIVERQHKRYLDEPGNALCLCAKHFAQWRLATKMTTEEITDQIGNLILQKEGGDGNLSIRFQLVDQDVVIKLCERHALALRKLVEVAGILPTDKTNLPKDTNPNSDHNLSENMSSPHIEPQVISPLTSSSALKSCPYCQAKVNTHNLEAHMQKKMSKTPQQNCKSKHFSLYSTTQQFNLCPFGESNSSNSIQ